MPVVTANIWSALYSQLTKDSTWNDAMGGSAVSRGRVYYDHHTPTTLTFPYAVVSLIDQQWNDTWGNQGYRTRYQVTVWDDEAVGPQAVMAHIDKLHALVHGVTFAVTGHDNMAAIIDTRRGPIKEDDVFRMDADILLRGFET